MNEKYLYHYTNLSTLAIILKDKTIKLNRLDYMDDLQERKGSDIKNFGKYVYASCWTDSATESIPMWNMYTDIKQGVMIKLKGDFLDNYRYTPEKLQNILKTKHPHIYVYKTTASYDFNISVEDYMIEYGVSSPELRSESLLTKVEYTNDKNKLEPIISSSNEKNSILDYKYIGKYKNIHWEFQKEWRFLLHIFPINFFEDPEFNIKKSQEFFYNVSNNIDNYRIPDFVLIKINEQALNNIEIIKSPKIDFGNEIILETLIDKYSPNATVNNSTLKGLL